MYVDLLKFVAKVVIILLAVLGILHVFHREHSSPPVAVVQNRMDPQQVKKALNISSVEAKEIARADKGKVVERYYMPSVPQVVQYEQTTRKEHHADKVIVESPKSTAAPSKDVTDTKEVNVYRISLKHEHKIKAGVMIYDNKVMPAVGYQAGRIEGVVGLEGSHVKAGTILYTVKEW